MNRKHFLRKGLLGSGLLLAAPSLAGTRKDNEAEVDLVGFNHIPNAKTEKMDNVIIHRAGTRGHANHGWLDSHHTFSFANYYNPERMNFGVLRVLNDDHVEPGMGFGRHPHDNMEIISIPLDGDLEHKDSMDNVAVIRHGDVQVMSAGTGIFHSEFNKNKDKPVKFLQIWVFPNKKNVKPRYDQITLNPDERRNKLQQILSPSPDDAGVWIHQDAWFHLGRLDKEKNIRYSVRRKGNGVYAFILKGKFEIMGHILDNRDGLGITGTENFDLKSLEAGSEILLMDVPMEA